MDAVRRSDSEFTLISRLILSYHNVSLIPRTLPEIYVAALEK